MDYILPLNKAIFYYVVFFSEKTVPQFWIMGMFSLFMYLNMVYFIRRAQSNQNIIVVALNEYRSDFLVQLFISFLGILFTNLEIKNLIFSYVVFTFSGVTLVIPYHIFLLETENRVKKWYFYLSLIISCFLPIVLKIMILSDINVFIYMLTMPLLIIFVQCIFFVLPSIIGSRV